MYEPYYRSTDQQIVDFYSVSFTPRGSDVTFSSARPIFNTDYLNKVQ